MLPVVCYGCENLVSYIKGKAWAKGAWQQAAEEDIWT